jgi:peptidoglycan-N-acetylglucosamine deacetylase
LTPRKPIFYDEKRRRWFFTRRALEIGGAFFTLLLITFLVSVLGKDTLPSLLVPDNTPIRRAVKTLAKHPVRPLAQHRVAALGQPPAKAEPLIRAAFYVSDDPNSLVSLKRHYKDIDLLIPSELHTISTDGSLAVVDSSDHVHAKLDGDSAVRLMADDKMHQWMQSVPATPGTTPELPALIPLLDNSDGTALQVPAMSALLANGAARAKLEENALRYVTESHDAGVCVDFEDLPDNSQTQFKGFVAELAARFHSAGLKVLVMLRAADPAYDYAYFGRLADSIVLTDYGEHWLTSAPGPVASEDWFVRNLSNVLKQVRPEKIMLGLANYGYDWPDKKSHEPPMMISFQQAVLTAYESDAQVQFDSDSLNPNFSYYDEHSHVHQVWFLDGVTAYNQLRVAERAGVQGTAIWRLGTVDGSIWRIWKTPHSDDKTRTALQSVPPGPDLTLEGAGDIWRIVDTPKWGYRNLRYDSATDTFTDESFVTYPLSYRIDQIGAQRGKIALTFDDGPDPKWTPQILDILKAKQAPATFFVIGLNANAAPQILKREYAEGHEIGNHTYTHEHFDESSPIRRVEVELNLDERLIESTLDVKTLMFRPPYGIDHQPETADEVAMLPVPQSMGYMLVGAWIDPHDWGDPSGGAPPPADVIVQRVMSDVTRGNIIMLHDGGGDRSHTVAALPRIIDALRAEGYQIVPVSELLGQTRAEVMPPVTGRELWAARADGFIFEALTFLRWGMATVFILGILLISARALVIGLLALLEKWKLAQPADADFQPPVSILIPAYNEEEVIVETVDAALASNYPHLEIIVVDDGSADRTLELLEEHFAGQPRVRILHQVNRGKPAALDRALAEASSPIVVTIDADTSIAADAVAKLVRNFADPRVGAVAGNVKVANRTRWLTRWQALEYITSQNLEKRAFDLLNCIPVVPGAVGAWRMEAVRACGGFTAETVAEDTDLTIAIRRSGWRISYDEEAVGYTQAPETAEALVRQRFRWTFGTLQSVWKHRDTLGRARYGTLGWVALPNIFLFQFLLPLFSPIIDLLFLLSLALWGLGQFHAVEIPVLWTAHDVQRSLIFFLGFMAIDLLTCVIAFGLEKHEDWSLLLPLILQRFYYRQMMYMVLFRALTQAVKGRPVGWRGVEPEQPRAPSPPQRPAPAETVAERAGD